MVKIIETFSPEAALDAPCPGYRPADDGEPVVPVNADSLRRLTPSPLSPLPPAEPSPLYASRSAAGRS